MKLPDQNLSPRLPVLLGDLFPGSTHVTDVQLDRSSDEDLWTCAGNHDFLIVSKDSDFSELSTLRGFPPKVIWLQIGNCTTSEIESSIRSHYDEIAEMYGDPDTGTLSLA